jgi:hypothetical protein
VFRCISLCTLGTFLALGLSTSLVYGQKSHPPSSSEYVRVNAPLAQSLVDKEMMSHSDIGKLGIHAIPPGAVDNVIIACNIRSKNGKKSSAADIEKLAAGRAAATRIDDEKIFDLFLPMTDAHGGDLKGAFVVMEVPFSKATTEAEALKIGMVVRDELQAKVPSRAALYQP